MNKSDKETILVHSKIAGQGYPHSDWSSFHERLDKALKDCGLIKS